MKDWSVFPAGTEDLTNDSPRYSWQDEAGFNSSVDNELNFSYGDPVYPIDIADNFRQGVQVVKTAFDIVPYLMGAVAVLFIVALFSD